MVCIALSNVFSFTSSTAQKVRCFRHQGSIRKEAGRANRKERAHKSTAKCGPPVVLQPLPVASNHACFPLAQNNLSRTAQCLQAFALSGSHHSSDVPFLGTVSLLCCMQSHRVTKMANNDKEPAYVVGVGMTKFLRPGTNKVDYPLMAKEAVMAALSDCRVPYESVQQACVGYVYGDSTCGQRALYEVGMTGIPIFNVNNNCSTGSTALLLANQFVKGGRSDCVLAVGFEKMEKGSLTSKFRDRANPLDKHLKVLQSHHTIVPAPMAAQMFGAAGQEHMVKYGTTKEHFAKIAQKNHRHALHNPNSQGNREYTLPEILDSPLVYGPLTRLQCCPTTNGAAAAVVASKSFVEKNNLQSQAIEIVGMEMTTDPPSSLSENSCIKMVGFDMTKNAAQRLYERTSITPNDVDVVELHDCFSTNELITYEALGLCEVGKGAELVDANDNTYGGKYVINPSGGLIAKGHPLGATGLAQCSELCWQLRGSAGLRQVPGAKVALQHNIGLGGAVVVSLYKHGYPEFVRSSRNYQAKL